MPPGDPAALRAALERLLGDAPLRERLGAAARERARERFSWDASTEALVVAYRSGSAAARAVVGRDAALDDPELVLEFLLPRVRASANPPLGGQHEPIGLGRRAHLTVTDQSNVTG